MNPTSYSILLLLFLGQLAFAQENEFGELSPDSALVWLSDHYVENPEKFHERALRTLAQTYQVKDEQLMAEAHLLLMRWHAYHVLFTIDSIFYHGDRAIPLFEKTNDQQNLAAAYAELALEYIDANNMEKSEAFIFQAIKMYEAQGDDWGLGDAYGKMSYILFSQQEYESAIRYGLEALEDTEQSQNYYAHATTLVILIKAYHKLGDLEKAILTARQNGASGITLFTADNLTKEQVETMKKLKNTLK